MKNLQLLFLIVAVPVLTTVIGGCSQASSIVEDAEKTFRTVAESESKGQVKVVSFTKKDGRKIEGFGVQGYELLYDAEIQFESDGTWITSPTVESAIGFNFDVLTGARPTSITADLLNFSLGGKPVRRGDLAKISGKMIGEKYESGWKFKIGDGDVALAPSSHAPTPAAPTAPPAARRMSAEEQLKNLTEQLKLTAEQQPKVKAVLEKRDKARQEARDLSPEERRAKLPEIIQETTKQMKEILTADQFKQYEEIQKLSPGGRRNAATTPPTADGAKKKKAE